VCRLTPFPSIYYIWGFFNIIFFLILIYYCVVVILWLFFVLLIQISFVYYMLGLIYAAPHSYSPLLPIHHNLHFRSFVLFLLFGLSCDLDEIVYVWVMIVPG